MVNIELPREGENDRRLRRIPIQGLSYGQRVREPARDSWEGSPWDSFLSKNYTRFRNKTHLGEDYRNTIGCVFRRPVVSRERGRGKVTVITRVKGGR